MKQPRITLSIVQLSDETYDNTVIRTYGSAWEALDDVKEFLKAEQGTLSGIHSMQFVIATKYGNLTDIAGKAASGTFGIAIGPKEYHFQFVKEAGEYTVTDDEMYHALEGYINSCRDRSDYAKLAGRICVDMHRYCQAQLWKFVKELIAAFARGRYDERNKAARDQACDILGLMETSNF